MTTIIYPYRRIITREYLLRQKFPKSLIEDCLNGTEFTFYYQAGFPQSNLRVIGEKDGPIEALVERLSQWQKKEVIEPEKLTIVHNFPDYKIMFAPDCVEVGELEELDDRDYAQFVECIQRLRRER